MDVSAHRMSMRAVEGHQMGSFHDGTNMYLTKEQYAMLKRVGLNFISCLLCFHYF
jgi:hypothetical protein